MFCPKHCSIPQEPGTLKTDVQLTIPSPVRMRWKECKKIETWKENKIWICKSLEAAICTINIVLEILKKLHFL
jgi:hypothetical protein